MDSPCTCMLTLTFPLPVRSMPPSLGVALRRCSGLPRKQSLETAPKGLGMLQNSPTPHSRSDFTQWFPPEQAAMRLWARLTSKDFQLFSLHGPIDLSIPCLPTDREMAVSGRFSPEGYQSRAVSTLLPPQCAPVAQLDRASDYESEGWRFESFRAHHFSFFRIFHAYVTHR